MKDTRQRQLRQTQHNMTLSPTWRAMLSWSMACTIQVWSLAAMNSEAEVVALLLLFSLFWMRTSALALHQQQQQAHRNKQHYMEG